MLCLQRGYLKGHLRSSLWLLILRRKRRGGPLDPAHLSLFHCLNYFTMSIYCYYLKKIKQNEPGQRTDLEEVIVFEYHFLLLAYFTFTIGQFSHLAILFYCPHLHLLSRLFLLSINT